MPATDETATDDAGGRSARRRWYIIAALVALAVGAAWFVVDRAPDYLAQYLARTYFRGLAIDTTGVETIDVNLWRGEITFGPVGFSGGGADAAQIGRLGLDVDVTQLLDRQALVRAVVEGVRLNVQQTPAGDLVINGVPLRSILAAETAEQREPPQDASAGPVDPERTAWAAGLDALDLRDSSIVFTDARGGEARLQVNALSLENFITWSPEDPGLFRLDGDLNGIRITAQGTATPFAETVRIDAQAQATGIQAANIARFTGPLGLDREEGRADLSLQTDGSQVFADGRVDARVTGSAMLSGVDLAGQGVGALRLGAGALRFADVRLLYDPEGHIEIAGTATIEADELSVDAAGVAVDAAAARVTLPVSRAEFPPTGAASATLAPELEVSALTLGGRHVRGTAARAMIRLPELAFGTEPAAAPNIASGSIEVQAPDLLLPLKKPITIKADAITLALDDMRFGLLPDRTVLDGGMGIDAEAVVFALARQAAEGVAATSLITIRSGWLQGTFTRFTLDDAAERTAIGMASTAFSFGEFGLDAPVAPGSTLAVAAPRVSLSGVDLEVADGATLRVAGRSGLAAPQLSLTVGEAGRPGTRVELTELLLDPRAFSYQEEGPLSAGSYQGTVSADALQARVPHGDAAAVVSLDGLRLDADDLAADIDNPDPQWQALLDLDLQSLQAAIPGALAATLEVKEIGAADLSLASAGPEVAVERLAIGRFDASMTRSAAPAASALTAPAAEPAAPPADTSNRFAWPPTDLPVIRIGRLGLIEGGRIAVLDRTVSPPAASALDIETLAVMGVDSTRPDSRADVRLNARLNEAALSMDGWALPFRPDPDFDLRAVVDALVLPDINAYLGPQIGLDVITGTLDATAGARAEAGQINGEIRARVVNLSFADRPEAGTDHVSKSIGVPLSTIISLLQDADGAIDLKLPFDGDMRSPDFDYSDLFWSTLLRVIRALITAPFKLISASSSLLAARGGGGEQTAAGVTALAAVPFASGSAEVGAPLQPQLDGLQEVLRSRPGLRLRLCGAATATDRDLLAAAPSATELNARLRELAADRMRAVQALLTADPAIGSERIGLCSEPQVDTRPDAVPRVDVSF